MNEHARRLRSSHRHPGTIQEVRYTYTHFRDGNTATQRFFSPENFEIWQPRTERARIENQPSPPPVPCSSPENLLLKPDRGVNHFQSWTHLQIGMAGTSCLGQVGGTSKMDSGAEFRLSSCSQGPRNSTAG